LNRVVDKQIIKKQVEDGKLKGQRKGLLAGTNLTNGTKEDEAEQ